MRMMWSTVSHAADNSSNPSIVTCPRSTAISKSEIIFRSTDLDDTRTVDLALVRLALGMRSVDCRPSFSSFSSRYEIS